MSSQTTGPEQLAQEIIARAKHIIASELERGLEVTIKADNSPVTQIDTRINDTAIDLISKQFPDDAIYAEEGNGGNGTSGYTWVIDPIDGTRALEMGMPTYTVCIARVAPDRVPDFSYVYNPSTDEMYAVRRGELSTRNGSEISVKKGITSLAGESVYVSSRLPAGAAQVDEFSDRLKEVGAERIMTHSLAFGVVLVAEGKAAAAITGASEPYELASVKPLVEGAGGIVSDLEGNPIEHCDGKISGFIAAANKKVLQKILDIYRSRAHDESHMQVIHAFAPDTHDVRPVRSGYVNDVYIVDEKYVFRFPKSGEWSAVLLFEADVLRRLKGHVSLRIPVVKHVEPDGGYAVFSYIHGRHHDSAEVRALGLELKEAFARDVAGFLVEMNDAVSRDWMQKRLVDLPVARKDEAGYYTKLLALGKENSNPYVDEYEYWYDHLMAFQDIIFSSEEIVIHGDLHTGNFIFDENDHLAGIFDFGDCMLNTVYFELRQLYHFGEDILDMAVEALGGKFGDISKDAVRILAVAHEFSILMRLGSPEETPYDKDRGAIARKLLQQWGEL